MNTTWFSMRNFDDDALRYVSGMKSLKDAWSGMRADVAMEMVGSIPTLSMRCRWNSEWLARKFALCACDSAMLAGPEVEALRNYAPVCVYSACLDVSKSSQATASVYAAWLSFKAVSAARTDPGDAKYLARDAATYAAEAAKSASAAGVGDETLASLVREAIPWEWVYEAAKADAPELLEVASP